MFIIMHIASQNGGEELNMRNFQIMSLVPHHQIEKEKKFIGCSYMLLQSIIEYENTRYYTSSTLMVHLPFSVQHFTIQGEYEY